MSSADNFQPLDFLGIAHDIENAIQTGSNLTLGNIERAWMRAAISRAYYSVFLAIRDEILNSRHRNTIAYDGTDHAMIFNILNGVLPTHLANIVNDFGTLRTLRGNSDYHMPYFNPPHKFEVDQNVLHLAISTSDGIINQLSNIRTALI